MHTDLGDSNEHGRFEADTCDGDTSSNSSRCDSYCGDLENANHIEDAAAEF